MKYTYLIPALIVVFMTGCHKKDKATGDEIPAINVAEAITDSVMLSKEYPGYIEAGSKVDVVGEVSGRLLSRNYKPGSRVAKGQVLFTIESTKYNDAVRQASAALNSAKSQQEYCSRQVEAMKSAYLKEAVSQMELLEAENELRQAEAQVNQASSDLTTARLMLEKCTVHAPISGYVSESLLDVGNYINGDGNPVSLATIYDNAEMTALFSIEDGEYRQLVSIDDSGNIYRNMQLKFSTPMNHSYIADLYYEAPAVDQSTGTLQLRGKVPNPYNELKEGMYVSVNLPYGMNPKAILIKDAAISTDQLGKYVYIVNDSNKVVYTPVIVGPLVHDTLRVIEKGIGAGDKYVTEAILKVRNGMTVKPVLTK